MTIRTFRPLLVVAAFVSLVSALAAPTASVLFPQSKRISTSSMEIVREAIGASAPDRRMRSLAALEAMLMRDPVQVGLDAGSVPPQARDEYREGVRLGIGIWKNVIEDSPFEEAFGKRGTEVVVRFVDGFKEGSNIQGQVQFEHQYSWSRKDYKFKLVATVLVKRTTGKRLLTREEVAEVVSHELGHLLGLSDVTRPGELMGPFIPGRANPDPTEEEVIAVLGFRELLRETIKDLRVRSGL
jgi:Zn-dependent protease with chaperone function